jgi:hypothetical protein
MKLDDGQFFCCLTVYIPLHVARNNILAALRNIDIWYHYDVLHAGLRIQ